MEFKTIKNPIQEGADPFILTYNGKYYLYHTGDPDGFKVYESSDLVTFEDKGYALKKNCGVIGNKGFWAPEIICLNDIFYMVYVCDEHLAIATSDSPLGPFTQKEEKYISEDNMIDGHFFQDEDGTVYLYYVRFENGNVVYGAKMNEEMTSIVLETEKFLLKAEEPWEISSGFNVLEGPFILKRNGSYYLSYSCNHTKSPDYAIGYATSNSPLGPYKKYEGNPILAKNEFAVGVGHHSFFNRYGDNHLMIVYHKHHSFTEAYPRMVCIGEATFVDEKLIINKSY